VDTSLWCQFSQGVENMTFFLARKLLFSLSGEDFSKDIPINADKSLRISEITQRMKG